MIDLGKVLVATHENIHVIKLKGQVKFKSSSALEIAVNEILEKESISAVLVDLTVNTSIDSTILGILAKLAIAINEKFKKKVNIIFNSEDVKKILLSVGFDQLFIIVMQSETESKDFTEISTITEPEKKLLERVLVAHKTLSALNDQNKSEYLDIVNMLQKKLFN